MDFTIDRNQLAEAVASIAPGLPPRPQHPLHAGMLVTAVDNLVQFTASDGQVVMNCMTEGGVSTEGSWVFPRVLAEIAKVLPAGDVRIRVENFTASLACGKAVFTFPVQDGSLYPFPSLELPVVGEVDGPEFRMALRKVLPALDSNNATTAMTAVLLRVDTDAIQFVAADHYMIAVSECDWELHNESVEYCDEEDRRILIPGRVAEKVARTDGVRLAICLSPDGNRVQVRSGGLSITSATLGEKFPAWEKAMSGEGEWIRLPEDLREAVKRAALTLGEKEAVMLDFDQIALTVKADGAKGGFMETFSVNRDGSSDWDYDGSPVNVSIGHQLLLQALGWCDEVCVREGKPLLLRGRGVKYLVQVRRGT